MYYRTVAGLRLISSQLRNRVWKVDVSIIPNYRNSLKHCLYFNWNPECWVCTDVLTQRPILLNKNRAECARVENLAE